MTRVWVVAAVMLAAAGPVLAQPADLRTLRVGMKASELPADYAEIACVEGGKPLTGWGQWRDCPVTSGERRVSFKYDDTPEHETVVAGQPVLLSLGIGDDGVVQSMTMQTQPGGRVFVRKRGVHFGERVMAHYGSAGWTCKELEPGPGEEPVGSLFLREHCEKTADHRHLVVDRALFRRTGQPPDKFTSETNFTISLVP